MRLSRTFKYSCLLAFVCTQALAQQTSNTSSGTTTTSTSTTSTSSTTTTTTSPTTTTTTTSTTSNTSTTSETSTTSQTTPTTPTTSHSTPTTTPPQQQTPGTTLITVTDSSGVTITKTSTNAPSTETSASGSKDQQPKEEDKGLGIGPIIGMSVAGGIAVIGIVAFFIWKFTRKRFSDFEGDEAIKWPELNAHGGSAADSHPLPVRDTGRSGFDTGSDTSLSRVNSATNYSTADIHSNDPYAVPPLPQFNPNQPYRDDPNAPTGYYEYHGAAASEEYVGRAGTPMNQMGGPQDYAAAGVAGGRQSPGPHAAYGADPALYAGRQSPGPYAAYDAMGRASPAPPGPQAGGYQGQGGYQGYTDGYDYDGQDAGRRSPGPQTAYNPQMGYGGRASPGPNAAYGAQAHGAPAYDAYGAR